MSELQRDSPVAVALPIADRRRSYDFYTVALGLEPVGTAGSDGIPEPLMLRVNDGLRLVLVPTAGFGSVIGEHEVAGERVAECLMRIEQESQTAVRALVDRARAAGVRCPRHSTSTSAYSAAGSKFESLRPSIARFNAAPDHTSPDRAVAGSTRSRT